MRTPFKTYAPESENILKSADNAVHGERQTDYGHPFDDYTRVAGMVNALLRHKLAGDLAPSDIALIMCCVKMSREVNHPKKDNRIDLAGFAWVLDRCQEQQAQEYAEHMAEINTRVSVPTGTHGDLLDIPHFLRQHPDTSHDPKWAGGSPETAVRVPPPIAPMPPLTEEEFRARFHKGPTMAERIAATNAAAEAEAALEVGDDQN